MIEAPALFLFLGGALLLNITPGPDMAFTLASSIKGGARSGIAAALGIGAGSLVWAAATAAGLAALIAASQHALTALRLIGGFYLLYLAIKTLQERDAAPFTGGAARALSAFRAGFITNLLNPKVGLFYLAFLPAFLDPAGVVWLQALLLGALFSVSGALVLIGVAYAADSVRARLAASSRWRRGFRYASATLFGGLGLNLLIARQS